MSSSNLISCVIPSKLLTSLCLRFFYSKMRIITSIFLCVVWIHGYDLVCLAFLVDFCVCDVECFLTFSEMPIAMQSAGTRAECLLRLSPCRNLWWAVSVQVHGEADCKMEWDMQEICRGETTVKNEGGRKQEQAGRAFRPWCSADPSDRRRGRRE